MDGFISTAAAMIADRPGAASTRLSDRRAIPRRNAATSLMLDWLGCKPLLDMKMRLGEGTGAALAMSLVDAACKTLAEMATFGEAGVSEKSEA